MYANSADHRFPVGHPPPRAAGSDHVAHVGSGGLPHHRVRCAGVHFWRFIQIVGPRHTNSIQHCDVYYWLWLWHHWHVCLVFPETGCLVRMCSCVLPLLLLNSILIHKSKPMKGSLPICEGVQGLNTHTHTHKHAFSLKIGHECSNEQSNTTASRGAESLSPQ